VTLLGDQDPGRRPGSASRALALLAESGASAGPEATTETAVTEPLAPDRTARTIPIGARPRRLQRRQTRVLVGPRSLAGVALLAVLIVLGVMLLSGGDEGSSTGDRAGGDATGGEARQQAPTTAGEEPAGGKDRGAPIEPAKASGKPKQEKPSKTPPGKAKGLRKH
jgi:hypothetical protein